METIPIRSPFPGAQCFFLPVTDSTMEEARRLASREFPPGTVVAADRQTSGRGRFRDRAWKSSPGQDLTFTMILDGPTGRRPGFPLRAGLALHRAVTDWARRNGGGPADLRIKWPNDLLAGGRKVAGMLCESQGDLAYLGIGVNCGSRPAGEDFRTAPGGLADELKLPVDRFGLLELFLARLAHVMDEADWAARVTERLWLRGERVLFRTGLSDPGSPGVRVERGVLRSVDDSGALVLETESGPCSFVSGELAPDRETPAQAGKSTGD